MHSCTATSKVVSARRASPLLLPTMAASTLVLGGHLQVPKAAFAYLTNARRNSSFTAAGCRALSTNTRQRDSSAAFTSKDGFSVVAPTKRQHTALHVRQQGVLLRLVEAMDLVHEQQSTLPAAWRGAVLRAPQRPATLSRPPSTAEMLSMWGAHGAAPRAAQRWSCRCPGGPQRIIDGTWPRAISCPSAWPRPNSACCPNTSSRLWGRMRSASGRPRRSLLEAWVNRSLAHAAAPRLGSQGATSTWRSARSMALAIRALHQCRHGRIPPRLSSTVGQVRAWFQETARHEQRAAILVREDGGFVGPQGLSGA